MASWEFEMQNGDTTEVRFFVGISSIGAVSINNFGIDKVINQGYLGIEKTNTGFLNRWNGYFYDFSIKQGSNGSSLRDSHSLQDSNNFWVSSFNKYKAPDGSSHSCHSSCDGIGCINSRPCRPDCQNGAEWCHLCLDYECQTCVTYDSCEDGACDVHATNDGNVCDCIEGWGRNFNIDLECTEFRCYEGCALCESTSGFSVCLECEPGYLDIAPPGASYKYCAPECPANFTTDCKFDLLNDVLARWNFNFPITAYQNTEEPSVITINTVTVAPSGSPAKNRGIYFDGDKDAYIQISNFVLSHSYSLITWCLAFDRSDGNLQFGDGGTVFHKVDTTIAQDSNSIMLGRVLSQRPVDENAFAFSDMVAGQWYLASWEFEMQNGDTT